MTKTVQVTRATPKSDPAIRRLSNTSAKPTKMTSAKSRASHTGTQSYYSSGGVWKVCSVTTAAKNKTATLFPDNIFNPQARPQHNENYKYDEQSNEKRKNRYMCRVDSPEIVLGSR